MKVNEIIVEVFQPGKTWEWKFRGSEEAIAEFSAGNRQYIWQAYSHVNSKRPDKWEVQFRLIRDEADPEDLDMFGTTGTGNSAEVMSIAVDITRSFLQTYGDKVMELTFDAKEPSRRNLYSKMIKRLLPNWDLHVRLNHYTGSMEFHLTNPKAYDTVEEQVLDEMPLPADWDPAAMGQGTSFKARLAYALERAKKLGTGSSRVAMTIEYEGRQTVLKVAKNAKGLAQNSVEADILSDGYANQLGILIPIIDYDEQHREPHWIHTEVAQKATDKQLCAIMKCENLSQLVNMAWAITGKKRYVGTYQTYIDNFQKKGYSEDDIETVSHYANLLADLHMQFDVELGDFTRKANWGLYHGKPVIVDVGFNSNVMNQYYK